MSGPEEYSEYIQGQGFNDPTSASNAILFYEQYSTSTNGWTQPWSCSVPPGDYAYFLFYGGNDYRYASILGGTLGLAEFAWTPSIEVDGVGATGASVWLSGFPDDTSVSVSFSGPGVPNGYPGGNVSVVQGEANDVSLLWPCDTANAPLRSGYTMTAKGNETGAVASTPATLYDCWP